MSCKLYSLFLVCLFAVGSIAPADEKKKAAEIKEISTLVNKFCEDDDVQKVVAYGKKIGKTVSENDIVNFLEEHVLWHDGLTDQLRGNLLFHMALHDLKYQFNQLFNAFPGSAGLLGLFPGMGRTARAAGINGNIELPFGITVRTAEDRQIKKFQHDMVTKMQQIVKDKAPASVSEQLKTEVWNKMISRVVEVAQVAGAEYEKAKSWTGWFSSFFV